MFIAEGDSLQIQTTDGMLLPRCSASISGTRKTKSHNPFRHLPPMVPFLSSSCEICVSMLMRPCTYVSVSVCRSVVYAVAKSFYDEEVKVCAVLNCYCSFKCILRMNAMDL